MRLTRFTSRLAVAIVMSTVVAIPARAQRFTLEHLRKVVGVSGVVLSPDGRTAVVTVTRPNYERNKNESELYAVDVASGAIRQLTFERRSVGGVRFSPDGRTLAFLAPGSDASMQVSCCHDRGRRRGASSDITPTGGRPSWRPDGAAIESRRAMRPEARGEAKHCHLHVGHRTSSRENTQPQHVWVAGVMTDVAPDERKVVARIRPPAGEPALGVELVA
jgi:dipeptidyl aminopeptidase/acylaminoacyl peptidase